VKSDELASTLYMRESSGKARIGAEVMRSLSFVKDDCLASPHLQGSSFFVRSKSDRTWWEKSLMNLW